MEDRLLAYINTSTAGPRGVAKTISVCACVCGNGGGGFKPFHGCFKCIPMSGLPAMHLGKSICFIFLDRENSENLQKLREFILQRREIFYLVRLTQSPICIVGELYLYPD